MNKQITIRQYTEGDAQDLASIYYHTIHTINCRDYSSEQLNAWAPISSLETAGWQKKWKKLIPLVALIKNKIVGFTEFEPNGHIDCFYVHHHYQGQGIGTALMREIEKKAKDLKLSSIYAEVSLTARSFFELKGFEVIKKQTINRRGVELVNFIMSRAL